MLLSIVVGCNSPLGPDDYPGAFEAFGVVVLDKPTLDMTRAYAQARQCSGLHGSFNSLEWAIADSIKWRPARDGSAPHVIGLFNAAPDGTWARITVRVDMMTHNWTLAHESLHHLLWLERGYAEGPRNHSQSVWDNCGLTS